MSLSVASIGSNGSLHAQFLYLIEIFPTASSRKGLPVMKRQININIVPTLCKVPIYLHGMCVPLRFGALDNLRSDVSKNVELNLI
jgi:hypothetical protein